VAAAGLVPLAAAALGAALGVVLTGCLSGPHARRSVDFSVLMVIAAALGVGRAVETTGLAATAAQGIVEAAVGGGPTLTLVLLYLGTLVLTEVLSNAAAAALMFPVAMAVAAATGLDAHALALTISIAAAGSFLTPIGYQTNLMVMGPGGYRYADYLRAGAPITLIVMAITVTVVQVVWF
jgi:di/tricarboxylate transporter